MSIIVTTLVENTSGASHCTGLKSGVVLANEFSEAFFFNSAGTKTLL